MFGNNYYCLIAGLPEVGWEDRKLSLTVSGFREMAQRDMHAKDVRLLELFLLPADHVQLLRLLSKQQPDNTSATVYTVKQLEDEIEEPVGALLPYLNRFIADFKKEHFKYDVVPENVLTWMYYDYLLSVRNAFVRTYAEFSMNVKNLVTALNCRKYKKDIAGEVIGDNAFARALRSSHAKDFGLGMDYPYVEKVISLMNNANLVERERGLDLLHWNFIEEATVFEYFSVEKVLSFFLRLMIVERWSKMSSTSGREVFMELVERFRHSFTFTDEFK